MHGSHTCCRMHAPPAALQGKAKRRHPSWSLRVSWDVTAPSRRTLVPVTNAPLCRLRQADSRTEPRGRGEMFRSRWPGERGLGWGGWGLQRGHSSADGPMYCGCIHQRPGRQSTTDEQLGGIPRPVQCIGVRVHLRLSVSAPVRQRGPRWLAVTRENVSGGVYVGPVARDHPARTEDMLSCLQTQGHRMCPRVRPRPCSAAGRGAVTARRNCCRLPRPWFRLGRGASSVVQAYVHVCILEASAQGGCGGAPHGTLPRERGP